MEADQIVILEDGQVHAVGTHEQLLADGPHLSGDLRIANERRRGPWQPVQFSGKKPKNLGYTLRTLLSYLGRHKFLLALVAVLVTVSALANLLGTYMIRPVVNSLADGGVRALVQGVAVTAAIYLVGALLLPWAIPRPWCKAAQKVLFDIRRDLFAHLQTLPLRFFDTHRHGDIMSYFTNDVDTISDALNNSFAMVIQSFIQVVGTLTMLFILNWRLTLMVARVLCGHVPLYPLQREAEQGLLSTRQQCQPGRAGRLHRGDGGRAEGGEGVQPRGGEPARLPEEERGPAPGGHRRPEPMPPP